ncbi:MAG: tryptophan synthase subunit alpha [Armatimonadetes bacterium 13_1_40CM_64_14]|nr:MAG: tryptophan synthase subunit alpha [Armatimonadetes bacterium 13_1_40CM_64_14]
MSRLAQVFTRLRASHKTALVAFVAAGDPDLATTAEEVGALSRGGADILELGVPFSDPVADGPVNQRAYQRALARGVTLGDVLDLAGRVRSAVPMVLLSYYNPVLQYGLQRFCVESARSGVDGLVVPDLPPDEADDLITSARPAGLDTIFLLAPTSTDARIRLAAARSTGFIYCVSVTGVTGVRDRVPEELHGLVRRIKTQSPLPVCVGFGVSTPQQARQIAGVADGVIVGSALVSLAEEPQDRIARLEQFVRDLREALDALPAREA